MAGQPDGDLFPCPCCGELTLSESERGSYEICPVCNREDDGVQFADPNYRGGANERSLNEQRDLFRRNRRDQTGNRVYPQAKEPE